ncbi:MAG TPA: hypothetical protein VIO38_08960 [Rariglobus sp.]
MSEHALPTAGWHRLLTLEPALVRGVIGALVALGLIWGLDFTAIGDRLAQSADILGSLVALLTAWWTRSAVTPASQVEARVDSGGVTVAGPASPQPDGTPVEVWATAPDIG